MPLARTCSTSAPTSDSAGCGAKPWLVPWLEPARAGSTGRRRSTGGSEPPRSTPSSRRMSVSAARPVSAMVPSARVAARGVGVGGVPAAVGLRDHHGQRVGDDVVHLPGDAGALGRGRDLRLLVALDLEPLARGRRGPRSSPGVTAGPARTPRRRGRRTPVKTAVDAAPGGVEPAVHRDAEQDRADERADDRDAVRPPGAVHRDGVERDQDGESAGSDERREERELEQRDTSRPRRGRGRAGRGARPAGRRPRWRSAAWRASAIASAVALVMSVDVATMSSSRNPVPVASTANRCASSHRSRRSHLVTPRG